MIAHGFQQTQRPHTDDIGAVFRHVEGYFDVALCGQIKNLVRLDGFQRPAKAGAIGQIAEMQQHPGLAFMTIHMKMIDPAGVETGRPANQAVDLVSPGQQKFGQVGTVLAGNPGN